MSLNLARGVGILQNLQLSHAFSRSIHVASTQSHVRHICLVTRGQSLRSIFKTLPSTGVLSQRLIKTYATQSDDNGKKAKPTKSSQSGKKTEKPAETKKSSTTKPKPRGRTPLTEEQMEAKKAQQLKQHVKDLKAAALKPPGKLPATVWNLALSSKLLEASETDKPAEAFKAAVALAKSISQEERERLSTIADYNRKTNETVYDKWIKTHTPLQIKEANMARSRLNKLTSKRYPALRDDRLVKSPRTSFVFFYTERLEQGDFKHMSLKDIVAQVASEWNGMTESEKEKYVQLGLADRKRYAQEYQDVYGEEPRRMAVKDL
ncbi:hypothetical protein BDV28DRAFT_111010 [Aspergillus coremiiformis]|uniref:HMG box domain-containing protein n=1 Tax=Aspergillus coremiiformis TaxID=138285 RepID=A0A5N6Z7X1_9EURO|nr:hypothetical protein BDV28DRAFT_111010 [Aspergillus coremiiformis]